MSQGEGGGRPCYEPTEYDRALVRSMAAAGLPQVTVQLCLPNAPKSPKTFRKVFRVELDTAPHLVTAKAMSKLVAALDNGEAWAVCFWLKCKAGFQETSAHRLVDKAGEDRDVKIIVEYADVPSKSPQATPKPADGTN